jgi:hypothetical protein
VALLKRVLGAHLLRVLSLVAALLFLYFAGIVFLEGLREAGAAFQTSKKLSVIRRAGSVVGAGGVVNAAAGFRAVKQES